MISSDAKAVFLLASYMSESKLELGYIFQPNHLFSEKKNFIIARSYAKVFLKTDKYDLVSCCKFLNLWLLSSASGDK
jgi:hypothetical protein